jgi:hypothetical protein
LDIEEDKALLLSNYCSALNKKLSEQKQWNKDDFVNKSLECLVQVAHNVQTEKEIIQYQYDVMKEYRRPMDIVRGDIEHQADEYAKRRIMTMFYFIATQYLAVQYGTYVLFSWDIMEPLTCAMTLGDAVLAYFFWALTKKSYNLPGIYNYFYEKRIKKLAKKRHFDQEKYDKIQTALAMLKKRIRKLM